jgi:hypothetical protein
MPKTALFSQPLLPPPLFRISFRGAPCNFPSAYRECEGEDGGAGTPPAPGENYKAFSFGDVFCNCAIRSFATAGAWTSDSFMIWAAVRERP